MRWGVVSDVHGNLHALRAVVAECRRLGVDGWLCAGDVVGYGPQPNECVALLAELDAVCVAGNHELLVLGRLDPVRSSAAARASATWTARVLQPEAKGWLAALPLSARVDGLLIAHGSLENVEEYVRTDRRAREQIEQAEQEHGEGSGLVLGHTHAAWVNLGGSSALRGTGSTGWAEGTGYLVNPGSVGQSRERSPDARFAVIDLDRRTVFLRTTPYDQAALREVLRCMGLPADAAHRPSSRSFRLRSRARDLIGRYRPREHL